MQNEVTSTLMTF